MRDNHDIMASSGHLTDSDVAAAIRYLDPRPTRRTGESDDTVIVIAFSVLTYLLAALPYISLYLKTE